MKPQDLAKQLGIQWSENMDHEEILAQHYRNQGRSKVHFCRNGTSWRSMTSRPNLRLVYATWTTYHEQNLSNPFCEKRGACERYLGLEQSMSEIITFPGPLNKNEAIDATTEEGWESGVVLTIGKDDTDIKVFGSPTSAELLWLSEQLRLKALYHEEDEVDYDEVP